MKHTLLFLLGIALILSLASSASAYDYYFYGSHGPHASYHYDHYVNKGDACVSFNQYGCSHGYPDYRYHHVGSYNPFDDTNDDEARAKRAIVRWTDASWNRRYFVTDGQTSAQAFGGDTEAAASDSNFRYREAYNVWTDGRNRDDYYYRTGIDEDLGYVNWRY